MFQLLTEEIGPWKFTLSMAQGTPGLFGPAVFVQSQRRQRFLAPMASCGIVGRCCINYDFFIHFKSARV